MNAIKLNINLYGEPRASAKHKSFITQDMFSCNYCLQILKCHIKSIHEKALASDPENEC